MIPREVRNVLKSGHGGVFYLEGDDEHSKDAAAAALIEAHSDPATSDFNVDRLRGSEVDLETLASVLGTPPMMAEWRVVLVREVQALAGSARARSVLMDLAQAPPPGLALILQATMPQGSRAKFYQDLRRVARSLEFRSPSAHDLPGWIITRARDAHGLVVEEDAARALAQAVGGDVPTLAREIEKFATVVEEGAPVTLEVVREAGIRVPKQDRWQWLDLVGERRMSEALQGLETLFQQGESGVGLTIALGTHFLRLGVVVDAGPGALASKLPPNQRFLADRYRKQAVHWEVDEVEEAVRGLLEVDRALKSAGTSEAHLLGTWLLARMVGKEAAA
jgi:DNA polymerase III subunit delta